MAGPGAAPPRGQPPGATRSVAPARLVRPGPPHVTNGTDANGNCRTGWTSAAWVNNECSNLPFLWRRRDAVDTHRVGPSSHASLAAGCGSGWPVALPPELFQFLWGRPDTRDVVLRPVVAIHQHMVWLVHVSSLVPVAGGRSRCPAGANGSLAQGVLRRCRLSLPGGSGSCHLSA